MPRLIENLLREVDSQAARLEHTVVWEALKQRSAKGSCMACGREVAITEAAAGLSESTGRALREGCTRDYIMKKPSLQRQPIAPPRAPALLSKWHDSAAKLLSTLGPRHRHEPVNSDSR